MYGFEPNEEQGMLVEAVRRFALNDLRAAAHDADEGGELPPALIQKGWDLGILQASIPEAYGGMGEHSAVTGALAAEELGYGDIAAGMAVMAPATFAIPVLLAGTEDQKAAHLPPIVEGAWKPYASAFVEPDFDFYAGDMRTAAAPNAQGYVINGVKAMVPFADRAQGLVVYAALDGKPQAFLVSPGTEGVKIGEREKLLGLGALPLFRVQFDSVHVPAEARLGGADGHDPAPVIAASQIAVAALAVGLSRGAFDYAVAYAKDREVFGTPIAQKQSIAFSLAEMAIEIEAVRLLVWEAAWMLDAGNDASKAAYLALTGASDMAMMVTDRAVQILGGHGYIREHPVERWMRNGRGVSTFTGLAMV
ncbi:MAG TPA: acyl-CoA dehydrogenase family protein [Anaerolineales bacterium]|nr:acyl-CoA dehydrogenase family protein [Anaerolineales bacterium]